MRRTIGTSRSSRSKSSQTAARPAWTSPAGGAAGERAGGEAGGAAWPATAGGATGEDGREAGASCSAYPSGTGEVAAAPDDEEGRVGGTQVNSANANENRPDSGTMSRTCSPGRNRPVRQHS